MLRNNRKHFCHWSGQLTSLQFILSYEAGFYNQTILKVHSTISGIRAHAKKPGWLELPSFSLSTI
jgi:hypothetical protein